jgi:hypothetical protein
MTTVRLPVELEMRLTSLSQVRHKTKSQTLKDILERYFTQEDSEADSYKIGETYFGRYGSGRGDLSENYKQILKDKLRAKYGSH